MRAFAKTLVALLFILLLTGAGAAGYAGYLNSSPTEEAGSLLFTIEKGESLSSIARRLETEGLIRSAFLLRMLSRYRGSEARFQSGTYEVRKQMSALDIHDYLTSGNQVLLSVTIPEGWTSRRMAALLEENGIVEASAFETAVENTDLLSRLGIRASSAEGFLYPDTYRFPADFPAEAVVEHLVRQFFEMLEEVYPDYQRLTWDLLYEKVVLASIVEREYRSAGEAPMIAGVFYNRLDERMRLESCATVVYVMTEELGLPHPTRLFNRDLERQSPYNTYRNLGLPPGPISNPGQVSLDATFHPADTDYRFFVLRRPGAKEHHFSYTYSQHSEATMLYLKTP